METETKFPPHIGQKLKSEENIIRDIFIQCLVFNITIPLTLVGYEIMIANSAI